MTPITRHLEAEELVRYLSGQLAGPGKRAVEAHLNQCESCLFAARRELPKQGFRVREGCRQVVSKALSNDERLAAFDATLRQGETWSYLLGVERRLAPKLLDELLARSFELRRELVRRSPRYQLLGLAEHLGEESRRQAPRDLVAAREFAELGVEVADLLDPLVYSAPLVIGARALARAFLGNARRVASDLFEADRAFEEAARLLELREFESPFDRAEFLSLVASLRIDQGRYAEAKAALQEAMKCQRLPGGSAAGRVRLRLQLANASGYAGDPRKAARLCQEAARLARRCAETPLELFSWSNCAGWLVDSDEFWEALTVFEQSRPLAAQAGPDFGTQLRRRWIEGRILAGFGDLPMARTILEEVRQAAAQREMAYEHAAVGLDLAGVLLRDQDWPALRELAASMVPIFESRQLHAYLLAALYLFRRASENASLNAEFLGKLQAYWRTARNNPYSRFDG